MSHKMKKISSLKLDVQWIGVANEPEQLGHETWEGSSTLKSREGMQRSPIRRQNRNEIIFTKEILYIYKIWVDPRDSHDQ